MLFWALMASGQIAMRKVDGWRSPAERHSDQTIDLAASSSNLVPSEITPKQFPTTSATAPANGKRSPQRRDRGRAPHQSKNRLMTPYRVGRGLAGCRRFGQSQGLRSSNPAWGTARVNSVRLVLLGLAALAGIVAGAALLQKAIRPETSSAPLIATASTRPSEPWTSPREIDAARRTFEEKLKTAPEYAAFFDRLKTVCPAEYESFLGAFAQPSAASGEIASADLLMAEAARSLRLSRGILAAKAGRQALAHIFELHFAMLRALAAKDPRLCVNFLYGSESAGFFEFSAQNRGLVAALAIAGIDAIHDGEIKRIERPAPTGKDFDALEKALHAKGLDTPEIEALLDGKAGDPPMADAKMCRAGQVYLDTLVAMPEPTRLRIYSLAVELMARS